MTPEYSSLCRAAARPAPRTAPTVCRIALLLGLIGAMVAGCASQQPRINIDWDRSANFAGYSTFAFVDELGTDRAGYSTLVTNYFKAAVMREMRDLGYRYDEGDPDLLVNFFAKVRDVSEVRRRSTIYSAYGYYGYRFGIYGAWPRYAEEVDTVHYRVGTANIDVVDAERRQLIWEAVAEGRLTQSIMADPQAAISAAVADMFRQYPALAASGDE